MNSSAWCEYRKGLRSLDVDLGRGRSPWRQEAGSKILWKKSRERYSLREANELRFAQYNMEEYGILRVRL